MGVAANEARHSVYTHTLFDWGVLRWLACLRVVHSVKTVQVAPYILNKGYKVSTIDCMGTSMRKSTAHVRTQDDL